MMNKRNGPFIKPVGPSTKRNLDGPKPPSKRPTIHRPSPNKSQAQIKSPAQNNHLLAGYLAHEFLTTGCLFREPWDPARAEAMPVSADSRREKMAGPPKINRESYLAVGELLKTDEVKLPGIVNPSQLGSFLKL